MHVYSAREDQVDKLADLAGAAFENYPLHTAVKGLLAEPEKFSDWIRDLHGVMIRVFVRYHTVLVLEDQGKILGVAALNRRPPGLLEYLRYCKPLLGYMRFDRLVRFFSFTEAADSVVRKASDFQWFLTVIAVDPEFQHRGLGRLFLERGIEGYIRSHGGAASHLLPAPQGMHTFIRARDTALLASTRCLWMGTMCMCGLLRR